MEPQTSEQSTRKGVAGLLIQYPLTCLTITVLFLIAAVLYISIRYASKETMSPPDVTALLGLSRRLYQEGDYDKTIAINEQLDQRQNRFWQAELTTGNAYFKKGDYSNAMEHFTKATTLSPEIPLPYLNLALACFRAGQMEQARKWYTHVIEHFGEEYPQLKEKASTALECMNAQTPAQSTTP